MKAGSLLMKIAAVLLLSVFCIVNTAIAQGAWTFIIESGNRTIHVYKPSVESFNTTKMSFRAAISVAEGKESPVFGSMWADADLKLNNSERTVEIKSISIADLRFPDGFSATQESDLNRQITSEMARRKPKLKMDDILADLENVRNEQTFSGNMNNNPPVIIYANKPTVLVTIDGEPIVQST